MSGTTTRPSQDDVRVTFVRQPFRLSVRFAWARTRAIPGPILGAFPRPLVDRDVRRTGWIPHTALLDTEPSPVTLTRPSHFESWISTTLAATPGRLMARDGSGMSKPRLWLLGPVFRRYWYNSRNAIAISRRDQRLFVSIIETKENGKEKWKPAIHVERENRSRRS